MGYTPLYDHMLSGTLFGRWPHTGIWACLLSRASREGVIDEVPASLAAAIGVPVEMLLGCIDDFLKPDQGSRTKDHDGRRLELIDPNRDWGWRVLNHGKYREKARKSSYDSARTESGVDADRKRSDRGKNTPSREVPTRPAKSRDVPLSDADAEANKKKRAFAPPSIDEIKSQMISAGSTESEAVKFHAYYESNGWKVGKNRMTNWKAAVTGWVSRSDKPKFDGPRSKEFGT